MNNLSGNSISENAPRKRSAMIYIDAVEFACGGILGMVFIAFWNAEIIIMPKSATLGTRKAVSTTPIMKLKNSGIKSSNSNRKSHLNNKAFNWVLKLFFSVCLLFALFHRFLHMLCQRFLYLVYIQKIEIPSTCFLYHLVLNIPVNLPEDLRMNFSCFIVIGKQVLLTKYVSCVGVRVSSSS